MRGPLLYCVEGACPERSRRACPDGSTSSPRQLAERADLSGVAPRDLCLSADAEVSAEFRPDLLGGVAVLRFLAEVVPPDAGWAGRLYRTVRPEPGREAARPTCSVTAIPYYAWANRTPGPMQVWLTGR
jgi:DUF1680 family protein